MYIVNLSLQVPLKGAKSFINCRSTNLGFPRLMTVAPGLSISSCKQVGDLQFPEEVQVQYLNSENAVSLQ